MGTEKFIAFKEDGSAYRLKGRILRFLDNEPVSEADKTNIRSTLSVPASAEGLTPANNLSDLDSAATARTNLSVNSIAEDAEATGTKLVGPALYFDGSNDYVEVADSDKLSFTDGVDDLPFSISAWVKMDDATSFPIAAKYTSVGEWLFLSNSSDKLRLRVITDGSNFLDITSNDTLTAYEGKWTHLAVTYAGAGPNSNSNFSSADAGVTLYVNGQSVMKGSKSETGTYAGMSDTAEALRIGEVVGTFGEGYIRDVKIFNRELSVTEVAQLHRAGDLGFADEWGGAFGGLYSSDFTGDSTDSWTPTRATLDATSTVGSDSDNLKLVCDATASNTHYMIYTFGVGVDIGKRYRVEFDYYMPSGQTAVDSFAFYVGSSSLKHSITSPATNAWTRYTVEAVHTGTSKQLQIYLNSAGANAFNGVSGEYVAFRNIKYTEIGTLADFRAEDYNESASKLLDRSSNNFVGVGTGVTLVGNQRHISADTIDLKNLPTSSAGLSAGEVWSNSGVLTVV